MKRLTYINVKNRIKNAKYTAGIVGRVVYQSVDSSLFKYRNERSSQMNIIGIDHGFGACKTANTVFQSGVVESETVPFTTSGVVKYNRKYYICGSGRQGLTKDKTEDDNYFILTLAALAKEIEYRGLERNCDVVIAAGLPLTTFGRDKEAFEKYLNRPSPIKFEYEKQEYKINIMAVKLFPQGYSAVAYDKELLEKEPSQVIVDIGSWTVDCMIINKGIPDAESCRSLEMGIIRCIEETQEEVRRIIGQSVTPAQIEQILNNKDCTMDLKVKEVIRKQGRKYTNKLLKLLAESGFDTNAVPSIILGGGANILEKHMPKPKMMERDRFTKIAFVHDIHANAKGYEICNLQWKG